MTLIEGWNTALFTAVNASATPPRGLLALARCMAEGAPFIAALVLVLLWVRRDRVTRVHLLDAAMAAGIGLAIAQGITRLWYHPRPFELGLGHQFLPHAAEASFPSDHATLLFSLALPFLLAAATRGAGSIFALLALGAAWALVYLGVHFPMDMAGALAVAAVAATIVAALHALLHERVYPQLLALYEMVLIRLGLPARIFPRGSEHR